MTLPGDSTYGARDDACDHPESPGSIFANERMSWQPTTGSAMI